MVIFSNNSYHQFSDWIPGGHQLVSDPDTPDQFMFLPTIEGERAIRVIGTDLVFDDAGWPISGTVTQIDYLEADLSTVASNMTGMNWDAAEVAQALDDALTLTGDARFAGLVDLLRVEDIVLNASMGYMRYQGTLYDYLPDPQSITIMGGMYGEIIWGYQTGTVIYGNGGVDRLDGFNGDDTLYGGANNDYLRGFSGDDVLFGGHWRDNLQGGSGNDILHGGNDHDQLSGGSGNDRLHGGAGNDFLTGDFGFDTLYGGTGNDTLRGGGNADWLFGEDGNDLLEGSVGSDRLYGGTGEDSIEGLGSDDALFGQQGNDLLSGNDGNDRIFGGTGHDTLEGNDGNDFLSGDAGFDRLDGGLGNDSLIGGYNADTFIFADGFGQDTIADFEALNPFERIDLSGVTAITNFADLHDNHLFQIGADVVIDTGDGSTITLTGTDLSDLDASDFIF
jgi:hypothetical protein